MVEEKKVEEQHEPQEHVGAKPYKDLPGMKTKEGRRDFAFLAGARILQGVGLMLLLQAGITLDGTVQVASAIACIVVYVLSSYFELIYHES
jgi:hypothetical protein